MGQVPAGGGQWREEPPEARAPGASGLREQKGVTLACPPPGTLRVP